MIRFLSSLIMVLSLTAPAQAEPLAKHLFGAKQSGSKQAPAAYGSYSKGCLAGGVQLPQKGPHWLEMRVSRNRNWGHPELIKFIERLGRKTARMRGSKGLYISDLSQPRGGPMTSGHRSHQIGLDADIWLMPATTLDLSIKQRAKTSAVSYRRHKGAFVNSRWGRYQHAMLRAAAKDKAVARIFVFPGAKVQMCKDEKGDRSWLRKIRPWWGHHYHFHVRLKCPKGQKGCKNQPPPPPGDGCADAQEWVDNILNPPPPDPNAPPRKKRREYTLSDLPAQCRGVLASR
ncbi:MAG: penicillin-insensitive murein endopeptidase [Rhodobacterales bacterium]|nr:MAG: penicillin-insensitive murein endopeptidase [Rhodobacterales bacterium]